MTLLYSPLDTLSTSPVECVQPTVHFVLSLTVLCLIACGVVKLALSQLGLCFLVYPSPLTGQPALSFWLCIWWLADWPNLANFLCGCLAFYQACNSTCIYLDSCISNYSLSIHCL